MEFNPNNTIVQLCLQGMATEEKGNSEQAGKLFHEAWNQATHTFEKYLAAYFIGRYQKKVPEKLQWLTTALQFALRINDESVKSAYPSLYGNIAKCYEELNDPEHARINHALATSFKNKIFDKGPFYHGTRVALKTGDLLTPGIRSNYHSEVIMNHVYFTALVNGAGLAAALAKGDGPEHVYIVKPTGSFENDPNVTDKKFPGNPTRSYRSAAPLKIISEVTEWGRLSPEDLQNWRQKIKNVKGEIIN